MTKENKKLALFDFDGVLVDTMLACYTISSQVNENLSIEEWKGFFVGNVHDAKRANGDDRKKHPTFPEQYQHHTRELKIPPVLKAMLTELSKDAVLVVVSSTQTDLIQEILVRENVDHYFSDILGRDIHTSKVVKTKIALEKYNTEPTDAVFITDTLGDIYEATECGVSSVAVTWGFHEKSNLEKGSPVVIVDSPEDLLGAIRNTLGN